VENKKEKFITLKEASRISGYSQDYLGQLIRKGKLPGKQVYFKVAWMTSEEALRQYMEREKSGRSKLAKRPLGERFKEFTKETKIRFLFEWEVLKMLRIFLYITIVFSLLLSLVLFYVFSVSFDRNIDKRILQKSNFNFQKNEEGFNK